MQRRPAEQPAGPDVVVVGVACYERRRVGVQHAVVEQKPQGFQKMSQVPQWSEFPREWEDVRWMWREISGEMLSRQRLSQIEQCAMEKIRQRILDDPVLAARFAADGYILP